MAMRYGDFGLELDVNVKFPQIFYRKNPTACDIPTASPQVCQADTAISV